MKNYINFKTYRGQNYCMVKFNKLTCLYPVFKKQKHTYWKCVCDCGKITYCRIDQLKNNEIKSCGCLKENKHVKVGDVYGRLTVIKQVESNKFNQLQYLCKCSCKDKNEVIVTANKLKSNHTRSCGCLVKEINKESHTTHGMIGTKLYSTWQSMLARCYNKNNCQYKNYGNRGISVCAEWKNSFKNFKEDMYESYLDHVEKYGEKDTTLDRIDVNRNYCKENCRWATLKEQANNKRTNILLTDSNGETKTLKQWSEYTGINENTIRKRILILNWEVDEAIYTPVYGKKRVSS